VFLEKRLQAIENKRSQCEKTRRETQAAEDKRVERESTPPRALWPGNLDVAAEILWGNADVFQNKGVAKKAIHKCLKLKDEQIDARGGAIHKYMKRKDDGKWVVGGA
jgi:hypothetical protein